MAAMLDEQVALVADMVTAGITDRATGTNMLAETTGVSPVLCASMLTGAILDRRAAEKRDGSGSEGDR